MSILDWSVLLGTLIFIVVYGVWKTRGSKDIEGYLRGNQTTKWWTIGLSIMATQASAITFLSTPGQAYSEGMGFVQFYFGLPIAMIILSVTVIPIYFKLKVYTAYEFLENRFDLKTRTLSAFLFLVQRGLATGITIYAPAIILSSMLGWSLFSCNLLIGMLVIIYTVSGGTRAVSQTQKHQMFVIMVGMFIAFGMILHLLPDYLSFSDALHVAGKMERLDVINLDFNLNDRYNIWSGILGYTFLGLSYFGTDQSQVARYLSGKNIGEIRLGLMFNGLLKIPMQFFILLVGAMVFVFYQFYEPPVFFNEAARDKVYQSPHAAEMKQLEEAHQVVFQQKEQELKTLVAAVNSGDEASVEKSAQAANAYQAETEEIRSQVKTLVKKADPKLESKDTDYVFITFVMNHLPEGLIGLLLAVIFSAAMSSTSSELNALASTTAVDLYKRSVVPRASERHYLKASKWLTFGWGLIAISFATFVSKFENLIQAVNILGSLFYGTVLGIFLVAFYIKKIKGNAVFYSAIIAEAIVLYLYKTQDIGYLWFNVIGCLLVIAMSFVFQYTIWNKELKS